MSKIMDDPFFPIGIKEGESVIENFDPKTEDEKFIYDGLSNPFKNEIDINSLNVMEYKFDIINDNIVQNSITLRYNDIDLYSFKVDPNKTKVLEVYKKMFYDRSTNFIDDKISDDYINKYISTSLNEWIVKYIINVDYDTIDNENRYLILASYNYDDSILSEIPISDSFYIYSDKDYIIKTLPENCKDNILSEWFSLNDQVAYILRVDFEFSPLYYDFVFSTKKSDIEISLNNLKKENILNDTLISNIVTYVLSNNDILDKEFLQYKFRLNHNTNLLDRFSIISVDEDHPNKL